MKFCNYVLLSVKRTHLNLRLDLRRTIGIIPEAINKHLDMIAMRLLRFIIAQLLCKSLAARLLKRVIVAPVVEQLFRAQIDDIGTDLNCFLIISNIYLFKFFSK